jgi:hypothetical protein
MNDWTSVLFAHTPFRGNDEPSRLADSLLMAHRTFITTAPHSPHWWHRLHVQWRWMRTDVQHMNRLPLLRLAAAVLVALLALATASGLIGA